MTDQALLDLVDAAIVVILSGGAVKKWGEGSHQVEHMSLLELYALKQKLETSITEAGGGMFMPVREIDA